MKNFILTLSLFSGILFNNQAVSQCTVNAGPDQSFNCNATAQLFAQVPLWTDKNSGFTASLEEFIFIGDTLVAVGSNNAIYRSTNLGTSWTLASSYNNDNRSIQKTSSNILYAGGYNTSGNTARIQKSTDNGLTWAVVYDQGSREVWDLGTSYDTVWAVGINRGTWTGRLDVSVNGGTLWSPIAGFTTPAWTTPYAIAVSNANLLIGTGNGVSGGFKYSLNRGSSFQSVDTLIDGTGFPTVNDIIFVTNAVAYAVCNNEVILKSIDGGISWSSIHPYSSSYNSLRSIKFITQNVGFAVGNGGLILKTTDGGSTWTDQSYGTGSNQSIIFNNNKAYILTGNFHTLVEKTYQFLWSNANALNSANIQNPVATVSQTTAFSVTVTDENSCNSTDQVTVIVTPVASEIANDQFILPGQSLQLYIDADTNSTQTVSFQWWPNTNMTNNTTPTPTVNPTQNTTYFVTTTINGLACGTDSININIFEPTVNAGADKIIQYGGSVSFYDASFDAFMPKLTPLKNNSYGNNSSFGFIDFFSSQLGYVSNFSSHKVYKTTDGEIYHTILEITDSITYMKFDSDLRGAVGTNNGEVYYTSNGGQTWINSQPLTNRIMDIEFTSTGIYVFGYTGNIKSSTNGTSWTNLNSGITDIITSASVVNANTIFVTAWSTTLGHYIQKTTNGGSNWTTVASNVGFLEDLYFINANVGFMAQYTGAKRTTDGGTTWTDLVVDGGMLPTTSHVRSIEFLNDTIGYMGSPFIKTIDGGATWSKINTAYSPEYDISVVNENTVFGAGYTYFVKYLAPQYTWTPATYLDNAQILKPMFSPGKTTQYILEVDMINNYSVSDTVLISVPDPCLALVNYTVNNTNNTVNFTTLLNQPPYTVSPFTFQWQFGDGLQSSSGNPQHVYLGAGYQNVHFTAASYNGCSVDTTFTVEVGNAANVDCQANYAFSVDHSNKSISVSNFSMGNNLTDFVYNFGDGSYAYSPNATHTYTTAGKYNVCLTVYSTSTGCSNIKCQQIVVDTVGYKCHSHFVYTVDSATRTATFYNNSRNNTTNNWEFGDGQVSTLEEPTHTYIADNHYIASLTVIHDGCKDRYDEMVNINVFNASLYSSLGYLYQETYGKTGGYPVKFFTASAGVPAKYVWNFGDGSKDSTTNAPEHEYANPGQYNVCLTVSDPASNLSFNVCKNITITSLNYFEQNAHFEMFPNPAYDQLVLKFENIDLESYTLTVLNNLGQEVMQQDIEQTQMKLDISQLPEGVYYVRVQSGKQTSMRKLLIVR